MAKYLLDANILIEPYKSYYSMEIAPGYWKFLESEFAASQLEIPQIVHGEIKSGDSLFIWLDGQSTCCPHIVLIPSTSVSSAMTKVSDFVLNNFSTPQANSFLNCGDPWLIAHGLADPSATVVTLEKDIVPGKDPSGLYQGKVRIPFVCKQLGVKYTNLYQFMKTKGIKLN